LLLCLLLHQYPSAARTAAVWREVSSCCARQCACVCFMFSVSVLAAASAATSCTHSSSAVIGNVVLWTMVSLCVALCCLLLHLHQSAENHLHQSNYTRAFTPKHLHQSICTKAITSKCRKAECSKLSSRGHLLMTNFASN